MKNLRWLVLAGVVSGCGNQDDAAKFVGAWAYSAGAKVAVNCGGTLFDAPLDTVVETFSESGSLLIKNDSQGCAGLRFVAAGDAASLSGAMQSCTIPANGMTPSATFAPSAYTFTLSGDRLTATVTASYTPSGSSACSVNGSNTLTRK